MLPINITIIIIIHYAQYFIHALTSRGSPIDWYYFFRQEVTEITIYPTGRYKKSNFQCEGR